MIKCCQKKVSFDSYNVWNVGWSKAPQIQELNIQLHQSEA